jgi:flavodoxin I
MRFYGRVPVYNFALQSTTIRNQLTVLFDLVKISDKTKQKNMKPIAIIYGSTGDNTKGVAKKLAAKIPDSTLFDVSSLKTNNLEAFDNLILGTSTWGLGDLQDDWDSFLPQLKKANLEGKVVALFGLGDSSSYSDTFVDGMGVLYVALQGKGCLFVGAVSTEGYSYDASKAERGDEFVGLALDEDNEYNRTDSRIEDWLEVILPNFQ